MAFLYLQRYPPLEAIERFSSALIRFATANGKPNLYHETITWAFLLLIRERMVRAGSAQTWAEFAAANPDLTCWEDSILKNIIGLKRSDLNLRSRSSFSPTGFSKTLSISV